jgi:putative hydrolase of the HAD superfamily
MASRYAQLAVVTEVRPIVNGPKNGALDLCSWTRRLVVTSDLGEEFVETGPLALSSLQVTLGEPGSSCYYVADNPIKDFFGPKRPGWTTLLQKWPRLHEGKDSAADVDREVATLDGLTKNYHWAGLTSVAHT